MCGAHDDPFGRGVGMAGEEMGFEGGEARGENLEAQEKLLGAFESALPAIVGDDRTVDLDAGGEAAGNGIGRKAFSVGPGGDGGPGE